MSNYVERVADRAAQVKVAQLLLTIIAIPFFLVGLVVGLLWLAVRWCYAAVLVGFEIPVNRGDDAG